jgi:hypothetical protein
MRFYILGLKELCNGEKDFCGLCRGNHFTLVHEIEDLGENCNTFLGLDLGLMEDPSLLEHGALINVGELIGI